MSAKALNIKFYLLITLFLICLFLILSPKIRVYAQVTPCPTPEPGKPAIVRDLASAITLRSLTTQGTCIEGEQARVDLGAFYTKLNTYTILKDTFFTKSKLPATKTVLAGPGNKDQSDLNPLLGNEALIHIKETNLNITGSLTNPTPKSAVIFVDGNLNFGTNVTYGSAGSYGLVFIVGGQVRIRRDLVTQIHGVIIAQGQICTASAADGSCPSVLTEGNALTINGSLIALDPANPIRFMRKLANPANPAEIINFDPKYLVNLRDLMSTNILIIGEEE